MTEINHNESTVTMNTSNYNNDYHALNAMLNIYDENHRIQFHKDIEAEEAYIRSEIKPKTIAFNDNIERIKYLIQNGYYDADVFNQYTDDELEEFYHHIDSIDYHFETFLGAFKFYSSYALKTFDGSHYLEDFKQRCAAVALDLANGDIMKAYDYADDIISGRYQPATPTFLNCGKKQRGEGVSCFLLRIEDNMESIGRAINSALQLSKRGGGVALLLSNLRELGAPIKHIENQSSGVIPVMKILEDSFSYANQLGARQGAGAVYLSAHHPDILRFLDTKRENADEKIRIKSLSLGVVIPDITFKLAKENKEMALFSPYDVQREYGKPFADISITENYDDMLANKNIHKTYINARKFFTTIAELQFESGYPYIMFEDTVNKANPIEGRVNMSNLCSEILQVNTPSEFNEDLTYKTIGYDISCNLGSMNIAKTMHDGSNIEKTVNDAINMLTSLSEKTHINSVPSIRKANDDGHAIGLGQMNLHGFLASENIMYGSDEALDFTDKYFMMIAYYAYKASNEIAIRKGVSFRKFNTSDYNKEPGHGNYFDKYINGEMELTPHTEKIKDVFNKYNITLPTADDWRALQSSICEHGLYNMYLQAVPPTGSISYINHSTSSIHPIVSPIEIRKEGKLGRVYYPAPFLTNDNIQYFKDAYEIGPQAIIDTYAEATKHVDQGLSLTLFYKDTATTRDVNKNQIYAWRKGIKTLYYIRIRQQALEGTQVEGCVSCML